ncbi:protein-serine/threonine kinase [Marchantia polymorpha subsp. ruderalis]|uniref:non-specific serine/threonine protein kinase n=3 Tax=Marchantia polymorpha TaxID=3197 RepID=A0A176VYX1_MARPO|nr:hypothetical protein AXG93_458s1070 [Marchantia polymorpha subsp. ruderalis]PTQ47311.1 hypothetical protein MARPO_0008s0088 [Marchantia polymorpha]BBN20774.1 hypothetical protein Mp_zg01290 [Marchantia polymorpha subsp. ruderalis]|eukprot:PTQ47311.1 hypothetical protein MARPO_0008s0088 [Marchantia polymorpha]
MVAVRKQDPAERSFESSDSSLRSAASSGRGFGLPAAGGGGDDLSRRSSISSSRRDRKGRISLDDLFRQQNNKLSQSHKPHKANDAGWEAIQQVRERDGEVGLNHFKLMKRLGCGDIGSVYLAELRGTKFRFAMKVMDLGSLASRRKQMRAETERDILSTLDHPFLPTLYAHFETPQFLCLVMEYCSGGDLHTLRQKQVGRCFTDKSARFYAAEVLMALEYLHMMGVVYRDLKPENVLVRGDGHVMLSDFDLSLRCSVCPTLIMYMNPPPVPVVAPKVIAHAAPEPYDRDMSCYRPTSCMPLRSRSHKADHGSEPKPSKPPSSKWKPRLSKSASKSTSRNSESFNLQSIQLPELIAEPTGVRSMSFVGTHEYLAPEIIAGDGHGSAVDWWTFGIFLYELLYGRTPFKGEDNEITLVNVVSQQLEFPQKGDPYFKEVDATAKELIKALLVKDPQKRLASKRGATEIKQHPFFEGINWALIRCTLPPQIPRPSSQTKDDSPQGNKAASAAAAVAAHAALTAAADAKSKNFDTPAIATGVVAAGDDGHNESSRFDYF